MDNTVILKKTDSIVARYGTKKGSLIALLQHIQAEFGYLPKPAIERLAEKLGVAPAEIIAVYSFYAQFRTTPVGRQHIKVCHGTACHVSGAVEVGNEVRRCLGMTNGDDTDPSMPSSRCRGMALIAAPDRR